MSVHSFASFSEWLVTNHSDVRLLPIQIKCAKEYFKNRDYVFFWPRAAGKSTLHNMITKFEEQTCQEPKE